MTGCSRMGSRLFPTPGPETWLSRRSPPLLPRLRLSFLESCSADCTLSVCCAGVRKPAWWPSKSQSKSEPRRHERERRSPEGAIHVWLLSGARACDTSSRRRPNTIRRSRPGVGRLGDRWCVFDLDLSCTHHFVLGSAAALPFVAFGA